MPIFGWFLVRHRQSVRPHESTEIFKLTNQKQSLSGPLDIIPRFEFKNNRKAPGECRDLCCCCFCFQTTRSITTHHTAAGTYHVMHTTTTTSHKCYKHQWITCLPSEHWLAYASTTSECIAHIPLWGSSKRSYQRRRQRQSNPIRISANRVRLTHSPCRRYCWVLRSELHGAHGHRVVARVAKAPPLCSLGQYLVQSEQERLFECQLEAIKKNRRGQIQRCERGMEHEVHSASRDEVDTSLLHSYGCVPQYGCAPLPWYLPSPQLYGVFSHRWYLLDRFAIFVKISLLHGESLFFSLPRGEEFACPFAAHFDDFSSVWSRPQRKGLGCCLFCSVPCNPMHWKAVLVWQGTSRNVWCQSESIKFGSFSWFAGFFSWQLNWRRRIRGLPQEIACLRVLIKQQDEVRPVD